MKAENKTTTESNNTPRKLTDGLYKFASGEWIWINDDILYLSATLLHPVVALTCGHPLEMVEDDHGKIRFFLRAKHLMEAAPKMARLVKAVAAYHQVSL